MGRDRDAVVGEFSARMVSELVENNTLRGSWVEQLVAHYLAIRAFPGQWSYFDLRDEQQRTISVKHATGARARFDVKRHLWAWDNQLAANTGDGWRGGDDRPAQYWCDLYCFGLLVDPVHYDRVTDPAAWRFGILSRAGMYQLPETTKTVGVGTLVGLGVKFVEGLRLPDALDAAMNSYTDATEVPLLNLHPAIGTQPPNPPPDPVVAVEAAGLVPD